MNNNNNNNNKTRKATNICIKNFKVPTEGRSNSKKEPNGRHLLRRLSIKKIPWMPPLMPLTDDDAFCSQGSQTWEVNTGKAWTYSNFISLIQTM